MNKRNSLTMMALFAGLGMSSMNEKQGRYFDPEDIEPKKKPIPKGCKEYTFCGVTVIALNEKSARKKIEKILKK